ncbi:arylsulfatase [Robiginitalea aurantiaca]|uniref:Arylsulfatase n=1 Tax=Robiginitalea aurantiaca TaxID=3056915 RepID=A0ABT7WGX2_9FLAO|nr:arylsulfatase [Robiginitalea aurantiaca]MDM9632170.1 arylsulfatase [Robiginitalea aurantiaca]
MKNYLILLCSAFLIFSCQQKEDASQEEDPRMAGFKGKIAKTFQESEEDWPEVESFTGKEPNVLLILLDDVGYGQLGPYGGLTETPNIDRLAKGGLVFNNFHTTALCSPSRAAILAGRNTHSIGMGSHALSAMGFPGYAGRVPMEAQEVTKIAQKSGWSTYALGKWDHTPGFQTHQVGPFTYWPTSDGFDHTYNFMAADANNFTPVMYAGHEPIEPSKGNPDYHLSTDLSDKATHYLTGHASIDPDRPFFMFWAPGGMHAPHHAPKEYIEKYKGKFDMGWDKAREEIFKRQMELGILPPGSVLTERNKEIPAWDSLTADEKRMYARQMEAFAGQLEHLDMEIGRMLATLERIGKLDNTLIILTSDNGASGEGGLSGSHNEMLIVNSQQTRLEENLERYDVWGSEATDNHYHAGWALAGNTPFKYFKQTVHNGGIKDPLIVHWPAGIKGKGEIRNQYHHIIDIAPTILEVLDLEFMEEIDGIKQMPLDGGSFAYSFNEADAADQHTTQYYEMYGNRAIYKDGWKAVTIHGNRMPWDFAGTYPFEDDVWELYNVTEDFTESNDLAEEFPEKLEELKAAWEEEAWKYNVFPLYDDLGARFSNVAKIYAPKRKEFIFYPPGAVRISEPYSPPVKNKNHSLTAHAEIPNGGASGVLVAAGGLYGGYTLYVKDNRLVYEYNAYNEDRFTIRSNTTIPTGEVELKAVYDVNEDKTAVVTLYINGEQVGQGPVNRTHPGQYSLSETFDVGEDTGTPVSRNYTRENKFSGNLDRLVVTLK